jgi:hypothetical protein
MGIRRADMRRRPGDAPFEPIDAKRVADPAYVAELAKKGIDLERAGLERNPDADDMTVGGAELMRSGVYTHNVQARELEKLVADYVAGKFPGRIRRIDGWMTPAVQADGTLSLKAERTQGDKATEFDFLEGRRPAYVFAPEGTSGTTRDAIGIETANATPRQVWAGAVLQGVADREVAKPGQATVRAVYDEQRTIEPATGQARVTPRMSVQDNDGRDSWVLAQQAPTLDVRTGAGRKQAADDFFAQASRLTGVSDTELRKVHHSGPFIGTDGPTPFAVEGRVARGAMKVMPDGMFVGLLGDAVENSHFRAGGGMNTAITEVQEVDHLLDAIAEGLPVEVAAQRYQRAILERSDAWGASGIPFFYRKLDDPNDRAQLIADFHRAVDDWRREGGDSPLVRLEKLLREQQFKDPVF